MSDDPYQAGIEIAATLQALDGPNVNPACHTRLYTHGRRTERSLVLLHGFTNCPQQFDALGKQFYELGWNVLIPRYPRHGYADRLTTSIAELRSEQLIALANRAGEAGAGLGERLTVAGLSLGGVLTAHLAQSSDRVERAVLIAPMFGLRPIPGWGMAAMTRLAYVLPNFNIWWDHELKEKIAPPHGYPRFATRAYAALFEAGAIVMKAARRAAPKARYIEVITNAAEPRLDNRFTSELVKVWRRHGADVGTYEFPLADGLPHDLIDPANPDLDTTRVYPVVVEAIKGT
ncbi:MAG TPA: alpha/beta fold hydrolase [Candidatus Nitrosopolaris sp.]|nr:alpha/beta fold hydrolase [Candidatus Nitrosopolaris sp.]